MPTARASAARPVANLVELQQGPYHLCTLRFAPLLTGDGLFDLHGCVFRHDQAGYRHGQQHHAARLAHCQSGGHVALKKKLLHRA